MEQHAAVPLPGIVEIPRSKTKLLLFLIFSILLSAGGAWLLFTPVAPQESPLGSPAVLQLAGLITLLFFLLAALALAARLRGTLPGLVITHAGITDNSSSVAVGQILWSDVENITISAMYRQVLIIITVLNPGEYINRHAGGFKREALMLNHQLYGSPCVISAVALKIKPDELVALLNSYFALYKTVAGIAPES